MPMFIAATPHLPMDGAKWRFVASLSSKRRLGSGAPLEAPPGLSGKPDLRRSWDIHGILMVN